MKTKVAILVSISLLLFSCAPATPTQEDEVVEIATEEIVTEEPVSQPITTEEPIVTEESTEAPTETPIVCVTLLTPVNGVEIPPVGKVTFSWTALNEAGKYVLNIILPSGDIVSFETDQTSHDQYMEPFSMGGEYQWQVITKGKDGGEICLSEVYYFNKSAYNPPKDKDNGGNDGSDNNGSGNGSGGTCWDGSTPINGECPPQN
ncbi:MAG: hypothetical protein IT314_07255 [Anaerolineales bacterium]|nr:hypothetical protein [Anaerolineales bacterium]